MEIPKLFISYSHDSSSHKKWTLLLATKLRAAGIEAILDQWELKAGDDLPSFMEKHLASADYILMICTESYVDKANLGKGGVGYEKMIITSDLMRNIDSNKVIPIIRQKGTHSVPTFLRSKLYIDMSTNELEEFGFDELIRTIHNSPVFKKPEIGKNPFESGEIPDKPEAKPAKDNMREFMSLVASTYETTSDRYIYYSRLHEHTTTSKIMLDYLIDKAVEEGFVKQDKDRDLVLTEKGRFYVLENELK